MFSWERSQSVTELSQSIVNFLEEQTKVIAEAQVYISDFKRRLREFRDTENDARRNEEAVRELGRLSSAKFQLEQEGERTRNLAGFFSRSKKKIPFFGDVSNGKSAVLNAMLRDRVLPSRTGHTTDALLLISGWDAIHYAAEAGGQQRIFQTKEELNEYLKATGGTGSDHDAGHVPVIEVKIPLSVHPWIEKDTTLVDCPGANNTDAFDTALKEHCQDADVFVMVIDAGRRFMQSEKEFLSKAAASVAVPPVFFAINKWDMVDEDERQENSESCLEDIKRFCEAELKMTLPDNSCHFISATETLSAMREGTCSEYSEGFLCFEEALQEVIHQNKETLAKGHLKTAEEVSSQTCRAVDYISKAAQNLRSVTKRRLQENRDQIFNNLKDVTSEKCLEDFRESMDDKILNQINTISSIVVRYAGNKRPTDDLAKMMQSYMENELSDRIREWIQDAARGELEKAQEVLTERLAEGIGHERYKLTFIDVCQSTTYSIGDVRYGFSLRRYRGDTVTSWWGPTINAVSKVASVAAGIFAAFVPVGWLATAGIFAAVGGANLLNQRQKNKENEIRDEMIAYYSNEIKSAMRQQENNIILPGEQALERSLCEMYTDLMENRRQAVQDWLQEVLISQDEQMVHLRKLQSNIDEIHVKLQSLCDV